MKAIEKSSWRRLLLLGSLVGLLLLNPSSAWAQNAPDPPQVEDPPAPTVPLVRVTKNGTEIREGPAPTNRRIRTTPWPHDVPVPLAEPDGSSGAPNERVLTAAASQASLPDAVAVPVVPVERRIRPEGSWPHDVQLPVAEPDGEPQPVDDPWAERFERSLDTSGLPSNLPTLEAKTLKSKPEVAKPFLESSSLVLRSGDYRVLSVVGSFVDGAFPGGGIASSYGRLGEEGQAVASLQQASDVPTEFALEANYPNPFNPETTIRFALPQASHVMIEVFDILGREVARLVDRELEAGNHSVVFEGGHLSSGIYVYQMTSGSFKQHRTMLLVK